MEISIDSIEHEITARISGPVTESDSDGVRQVFDELLEADAETVKLDLSLVPIITSTGIGKIIVLYKRLKQHNRQLVISGIHDNLAAMFASINLDKMLTIEKNGG